MSTDQRPTAHVSQRGMCDTDTIIRAIQQGDRQSIARAVCAQRMGYHLSYVEEHYQLHVVDRYALYPLYYTIHEGVPRVSQVVDDLLPYLSRRVLHREGFYHTGGMQKGERSPYTPFVDILRIPPGHFLEYREGRYELVRYWSFDDMRGRPYEGSYEDACNTLGDLIHQAVDRCYAYEQDLAVHLSGGLDSGSITALLGQIKPDTIEAYAHVKEDAPDIDDILENGYLRKYAAHAPQLHLIKTHHLPYIDQGLSPIHSAGNWYGVRHDSPEGHICQDMRTKGLRYILSGMGGDELASYGHGHQRSQRVLHSDADARRFMYRQIYLRRMATFTAKGILGKDGPRLDSLASTWLPTPLHRKRMVYHPDYRRSVPDLRDNNVISLYWFPSSYEYRLETLQRSFFTIRADIWNYLGHYYGVDYAFPLLDADLVEFCASIPREFFMGRPQRDMIKKGLRTYLPAELLDGDKRPTYQPPASEAAQLSTDPEVMIAERYDALRQLKGTVAAAVYDIGYMEQQLSQTQRRLRWMPDSWYQTRRGLIRKVAMMQLHLTRAAYINEHFEDIES